MSFRTGAVISGGLLTQQIATFLTGVLIARMLGAATFGELSILKNLSMILLIVTPLGLDLSLLKHASHFHDCPAVWARVSFLLRTIVAGLNVFIFLIVLMWIGPTLQLVYKDAPDFARYSTLTMISVIFLADIQVTGALFRVADRVVTYAIVILYLQPIARLALSYWVIYTQGSLQQLLWVNILCAAISGVVLELKTPRSASGSPLTRTAESFRHIGLILSESSWMAISLLMYQALRLIDVIMLGSMTSIKITGEYSALSGVCQIIQIYPMALSQTLGPEIARLYKFHRYDAITALLRKYVHGASLLGGYMYGGVAVFGSSLDLIFGSAFTFPLLLSIMLSSSWYLSAILSPFGYVLSMTGRHRLEAIILTGGTGLMALLLFLLIPAWGNIGAAVSVLATFMAVNLVRFGYVSVILGTLPLAIIDFVPPLIFILIAALCLEVTNAMLGRTLSGLVLGCGTYTLLSAMIYLGAFASKADRKKLKSWIISVASPT